MIIQKQRIVAQRRHSQANLITNVPQQQLETQILLIRHTIIKFLLFLPVPDNKDTVVQEISLNWFHVQYYEQLEMLLQGGQCHQPENIYEL